MVELVGMGLAREPVADDPAVGALGAAELGGAFDCSEPGEPMVLTEVATDVGAADPGDASDEPAGVETPAELGDPDPGTEGPPPTGAVNDTVCTEVSVESGGLSGLPATTDVAEGFPGLELLPPAEVTTVTKDGEVEPGLAEGRGGIIGPGDPGPPALGPPTVDTVVEPGLAGALEGPESGAPTVVALVTYEGCAPVEAPGPLGGGMGTGFVSAGGFAMMVMTEGTGPPIVVTMVMGGGGPEPNSAESGGSAVAITVITEGVGPSMVVTMVIGGGVPGAVGSDTGELGLLEPGEPALAVTVIGGGGGPVGSLEFEGTIGDEGSPGLDGADTEGAAVTVVAFAGAELVEPTLAGSLDEGAVVVSGDVELGNVELADVLGRAVLDTVSVVHSPLVSAGTDLELLKTVLLELIDEEEEVVLDSLQTPGDKTP